MTPIMPDPFRQMIDDLYASELARDGRYYPADGSPPFEIRVMKREPDEIASQFGTAAIVERLVLAVRQSQVPEPKEGDTLTRVETAGGAEQLYDVLSGSADDERLEWLLTVNER